MSTPLETWLERVKQESKNADGTPVVKASQAIAVIEKLKEALELTNNNIGFGGRDNMVAAMSRIKDALAIDPEKL